MKKLLTTLTLATSSIFAGGDIEPVEPMVDPVTSSGDAMTMTAMILFMLATTMVGLYFTNKQSKA
jgi:hypothetical protein